MALQLTIIKFPPGISLSEDRKTIGPKGGVIGRGVDNDWVLSDPERFLSSKHCQVLHEGGRFFLLDLSTNGTFLNGSSEPLGRGQKVALSDGDSFDVGDYRFKVSLTSALSGFPDSPFDGATSHLSNKSTGFGKPVKDIPDGIFMSSTYGGELDDIAPEEMRITDPLVAIDNANRGSGLNAPLRHDDGLLSRLDKAKPLSPGGSQEDSANRIQDAADWPELKSDPGVLPEDWDADISLLRGDKNKPLGNSVLPQAQDFGLPDNDSLIVRTDKPKIASERPKTGATNASRPNPTSSAAAVGGKPNINPARPKPAVGAGRNTKGGTLDRTLVDALGLQDHALSDDQIRDIHGTVGVMMREALDGLMQILRSRASIKNEFRINITTIQPVENNPIKFSANVDEIVELMFVRRTKAYKGPVESVEESFNTIADHQVAVIAGIRSAFRSALGKFDPLVLEDDFKQSGKGGKLPGIFKGSLWSAYQEHYQKMVNDMERSFQDLFGDEFVQAYEDQLRKLASARKNKK